MEGKKKKHYLTPINIFLLIISTIVIIFIIYISILLISRPPIFNIFGETGGFLPTSIPVIITASVLVAIFLSFVLMVPNIPVGIMKTGSGRKKKSEKSKTSLAEKETIKAPVTSSTSGVALITQPTQPQSLQLQQQRVLPTKVSIV